MNLQARLLSYTLGAEIVGLDLGRPIDDASVSWLRGAFLKYSVLLFRGRLITREQHVQLSAWFGEVESNDAAPVMRIEGHPWYQRILVYWSERFAAMHADSAINPASAKFNMARISLLIL